MFDNKTKLISAMRSPLQVEMMALDEIQDRLGGTKVIADGNSPFCHLLEFGSSVASACITSIDDKLSNIYPQRALTMQDLYQHMSDYDYLSMYSTPAQTMFTMTLEKSYLYNNTAKFGERYRKLTVPRDSVFIIGKYHFGIHYPIDILINESTKAITVQYDTSEINPLHTLTSNTVATYTTKHLSQEYLVITFPVYQFTRSVTEETLYPETGFVKKYKYNYNFYALRLHHYKNGQWHEMGLTQSENVYDVARPTALMRVYPDDSSLVISIPQIYFSSGVLGSKLYVELSTTLGAMDIDTSNINPSAIKANFSKSDTRFATNYASALKSYPYTSVMSVSGNITGGSNAIDVNTLRDRVVNNTLYESVPISEQQLTAHLGDLGFSIRKFKDNITDRMYYAYRTLSDGAGSSLPSLNGEIRLDKQTVDGCSTIIQHNDDTITILPSTIYKFNHDSSSATPLSTEEMQRVAGFNKQELVSFLNSADYFRSPFHIRADLLNAIPSAVSYNLLTPRIDKTVSVDTNFDTGVQFSVPLADISHDVSKGAYYIALPATMTSALVHNINDTLIYALVRSSNGYWCGAECELDHIGSETTATYKLKINTNYHITDNDCLGITNFKSSNSNTDATSEITISLDSNIYLVFLVRRSLLPDAGDASQAIVEGLPDTYKTSYVAICRQYLSVHFGHSLSDVINNNIKLASTSIRYKTWDRDVPAVYPEDVYAHDERGVLKYEIEHEQVVLTKLHRAGDPIIADDGTPIYRHRKGDLQLDSQGIPIREVDRTNVYYIDAMLVSAKVFASERSAELNFVNSMYATLESYFDAIRSMQSQLLERTSLYFKCIRSTGTATFNYGDNVTGVSNIEMSFHIGCYVPSYIRKDATIQKIIKDQICESIEASMNSKTISMLDIFETVKNKLSDYVDHFTLLGVNGDVTHQTFTVESEDAKPSIARVLVLTEDNILSLNKSIDVDFIALEDNTAGSTSYQ